MLAIVSRACRACDRVYASVGRLIGRAITWRSTCGLRADELVEPVRIDSGVVAAVETAVETGEFVLTEEPPLLILSLARSAT